ncbi:hypothetical protein [Thiolapillus sp.]|uniref:hypothetical protein n=1 Tax=Thiolapillus sp. TaxID=2017437 RepID=UPI003AF9EB8B
MPRNKRVFSLVIDFGTSQSPKLTRPLTAYWFPSRPDHQALRNNFASSLLLRTWLPYDWTPRSEAMLKHCAPDPHARQPGSAGACVCSDWAGTLPNIPDHSRRLDPRTPANPYVVDFS